MPTIFTHAAVPIALVSLLPRKSIAAPVVLTGSICSVLPDLDVVAFVFGIPYGDMFGHRGLTHSIAFAVTIAALFVTLIPWSRSQKRLPIFLFLFASTASHGILDSMTNGGLGVAFLAPYNSERYFFRWRLIEVSPLGMEFFSAIGARVLFSELKWIWCPYAVVFTVARLTITRRWRAYTLSVS
jgi:inner membrane protein